MRFFLKILRESRCILAAMHGTATCWRLLASVGLDERQVLFESSTCWLEMGGWMEPGGRRPPICHGYSPCLTAALACQIWRRMPRISAFHFTSLQRSQGGIQQVCHFLNDPKKKLQSNHVTLIFTLPRLKLQKLIFAGPCMTSPGLTWPKGENTGWDEKKCTAS